MNLADLARRRTTRCKTLDETQVDRDPMQPVRRLDGARRSSAQLPEPTAMTLATVDAARPARGAHRAAEGRRRRAASSSTPTTTSRKGRELAAHPAAALTFMWKELERQVRIEGDGREGDARRSRTRTSRRGPLGSRIGAWASPQSEADREPRAGSRSAGSELGARATARRRRARRTGAAIAWCPTTSSSGRAGGAACTTASPTRATGRAWTIARLAP